MKKRILSIALTLCMLLTVMPLAPVVASAETATRAATQKDITLGTSAIQNPTEVTNDSGKYYTPNSYIYFGVNDDVPIKWRVLDARKANDGTTSGMFLLSEYVLLENIVFNEQRTDGNDYQGSVVQTRCKNFASNSSHFSGTEQNAMLGVAKTDSVETVAGISWNTGSLTAEDKLFLPSARELADYVGNYNKAPGLKGKMFEREDDDFFWWLRSPLNDGDGISAGLVGADGDFNADVVEYPYDVRPALNLNSSKILFTSAAIGGKASDATEGELTENKNYTDITENDGYKLTLLDDSRSGFSAYLKSVSGHRAKVSYTGAKTGTYEYISAIIKNGDDVKYYGRVAAATSASGDVDVILPVDFDAANGDVLCVFNEQCNYDQETDYASNLIEVPLDHTAHCVCGGTHVSVGNHTNENKITQWKAVSTGTALAQINTSGNYYLSNNVTLSSMWKIPNGTDITLCLNGYTLTADNAKIGDTITIEGKLTITDCCGTGKITGTNPSNSTDSKNHKVLVVSTVYEGCTLNLYGGTITGIHAGKFYGGGVHNEGTFNMYGGTITANSAWYGGGVANCYNRRSGYNDKGLAEFNFYGGTITGNTATRDSNSGNDVYNRANSKINANGGEVAGNVANLALITAAEGYTGTSFKGNVNNKGTIDGGIFYGSVSGNGTITDNAKVTVTFSADVGTVTQKVLKGQKASAPTIEGYAYNACYTDSACLTEFNLNNTAIIANTTLYAKFTPNTYTVSYNAGANGTGTVTAGSKTHGVALTLSSDTFTRTGYTQTGWATTDGGEKVYDLGGSYTADAAVTLYPVWTVKKYTITVKPGNGDEDITITQDYGTTVTEPTLTRGGYTFDGWDIPFPSTMPAEHLTITAKWKDTTAPTGEITLGTNTFKTLQNNITFGLFFKDAQDITITATDNSGEEVTIEYLLSEKELTSQELAAAAFTAYTGELNIAPNNEYVIYAKLTDKSGNAAYINSDGIVLDNVAPVISGIEDGKTYCAAQTVTVSDRYNVTVTVNDTPVALTNGTFTLSAAEGEQKIVVTDKTGNQTEMTVTVNDGHTYYWQSENGRYWQQCNFCEHKTAKKKVPEITIKGANTVCVTQDYTFSFTLPKGVTEPKAAYYPAENDHPLTVTENDGVYTATVSHTEYGANSTITKFFVKAYAKTDDGFEFFVWKEVLFGQEHIGGTADCMHKAKCEVCGVEYGEIDVANHALKHNAAKAATTEAVGNTEYWLCEECGKYFSDKYGKNEIKLSDTVIEKLEKTDSESISPKTGDNSRLALWLVLALLGGAAFIGTTAYGKKKKRFVK